MESEKSSFSIRRIEATHINPGSFGEIHKQADPGSVWACFRVNELSALMYETFRRNGVGSAIVAESEIGELLGYFIVSSRSKQIQPTFESISPTRLASVFFRIFFHPKLIVRTLLYVLVRRIAIQKFGNVQFEIISFMVKPTAQSQGIGTSMIQAYFQEQKGQKVVVITNGIHSKRFYERNGFQVMAGRQFCKQQVFLLMGPD